MKAIDPNKWIVPDLSKQFPGDHIQQFIIDKIKRREIQPGEEIPSRRMMAELNGTSKNTVHDAYMRMVYRGWLSSVPGGKTYVGDFPPIEENVAVLNEAELEIFALKPENIQVFKRSDPVNYVSIGPHNLNEDCNTEKRMAKYVNQYIQERMGATQAQKLADEKGTHLHQTVYGYLHNVRLLPLKVEQLSLAHGHTKAIELVCKLALPKGAGVANAAMHDPKVTAILGQYAEDIYPVSPKDAGFLSDLEELGRQNCIKMLYIRPGCLFPNGAQMIPEICLKLVELAVKYQFFILEDDDVHEFRTTAQPFRLVWQYPHHGLVIYCGALSRLTPYLQNIRTVLASERVQVWLRGLPGANDAAYRNPAKEMAVAKMLKNGELAALVRNARESKHHDMEDMHKILKQNLGAYLTYELPESGLAVWLEFNHKLNLRKILRMLGSKGIQVPYNPDNQQLTEHVHHMLLDISHYETNECRVAAVELQKIFKRKLGY